MRHSPNVSTTPLRQWGFRQCLPFSWTTLRGKHCRHPIAVMGVVDTFGHKSLLWATSFSQSILLSTLLFSFRQTTVSAQCSGMSNECAVWAGRKCKWFAIYDIWLASLGKFLKTSITWALLLLLQTEPASPVHAQWLKDVSANNYKSQFLMHYWGPKLV